MELDESMYKANMDKRATEYNEWIAVNARGSYGETKRKAYLANTDQDKCWSPNHALADRRRKENPVDERSQPPRRTRSR